MAREKGENTDVNGTTTTATTTTNTTAPIAKTYFGFTPEQLSVASWRFSNLATTTAITSLTITAWQTPLKTLMLNYVKDGSFIPATKAGFYGFTRGFWASYTGSTVRSAYVIGTKKAGTTKENITETTIKEESLVKEEVASRGFKTKMGFVASAALGEISVTQIPESLSSMKKIPGLLPPNFKWHTPYNMYQLMSAGFVPRYCAGLVNFASLCIIEDQISRTLSIEDNKVKHFTAGALSGVIAATCSYPFAAFKDYTLVQATVNNGRLSNPRMTKLIMDLIKEFQDNPLAVTKAMIKHAAKQWPLRAALVSGTFGTIGLMETVCGAEPLNAVVPERFRPLAAGNHHRFFAKPSPATNEEPMAMKDEAAKVGAASPK